MDVITTCRFPGCERTDKLSRGLCAKHNYQATRSPEGSALRTEARKYLLPSARGPRRRPVKETEAPTAIDAAQQARSEESDEKIALVSEFATRMGLKRTVLQDGLLFTNEFATRQILLTGAAHLKTIEISVGEAIEIGAAEQA